MDRDDATGALTLAQQAGKHLMGTDASAWMDRLEQEHDRLSAALQWLIEHGQGADTLALVAAVWRLWLSRGDAREGSEWLEAALQAQGADVPSSDRAKALYGAGLLAFRQGEDERSRRLNEESLAVSREVADQAASVDALVGLARVALRAGDFAEVRARCEEGLAIARKLSQRELQAPPLHLLAAVTRLEGDYAGAQRLYQQSLALSEEMGNRRAIAMERINLGAVQVLAGDPRSAEPHLLAALRVLREQGVRGLIPACLVGLASVAVASGDASRATRLLGATDTELDVTGTTLDPDDQPMYDAAVDRTRAAMTGASFDAARAAGRALSVDEATAYALGETT